MRIAIMSDFHLGYSEDALPQTKMALQKAAEVADCIVAAGDLFDVRVPKQEVVNDAIKLFKEHNAQFPTGRQRAEVSKGDKTYLDVPLIAIPGTHERRTKGLVNVIEMLDSAGVIVNCHNKQVVIKKNGEKIAILGMAGVPEEYARDVVKAAQFKPLESHFNIFVFHQTLKEVIPMNDAFMCMDDLPPGFDLYINGHIHWRRELKTRDKLLLIPGSTVITQMKKNEVEKKGFWLFDTANSSYEFVYIDSRDFVYREAYFENATVEQVKNEVGRIVAEAIIGKKDPLVKIKLRGSLAPGIKAAAIDSMAIAASFGNAAVFIDKEFEIVESLREKIELIRKLRNEEKSVSEIGVAILKEKLKKNRFTFEREEELFSLLTEGEIEKAVELIKNHK